MIKPECAPSLTFEERYIEICRWVDKRRRKWDLHNVPWEDARQIILIHIYRKYNLYHAEDGPFGNWVNRVISNKIKGIWRDKYTNYARPCVMGCVFNTGGDTCSQTASGKQCEECPLYKSWVKRRKAAHDVKQTLPLESHIQEVSNQPGDFLDIEAAKTVIDAKMKERLTKTEYRIYRALVIQGKSEREVARLLGPDKKKKRKSRMYGNYQELLRLRHHFVDMAKDIIKSENLA